MNNLTPGELYRIILERPEDFTERTRIEAEGLLMETSERSEPAFVAVNIAPNASELAAHLAFAKDMTISEVILLALRQLYEKEEIYAATTDGCNRRVSRDDDDSAPFVLGVLSGEGR